MERAELGRMIQRQAEASWQDQKLPVVKREIDKYSTKDRKNRNVSFKVEFEDIRNVFAIMGEMITGKNEMLSEDDKEKLRLLRNDYFSEVRRKARELDELNRQVKQNWHWVEIEHEEVGRLRLPVVELNLYASEDDTPYVLIGGIATGCDQSTPLSAALAMAGKRVFVMTYPEQSMVESSRDWKKMVSQDKTFKLHARVMKETIKALGLSNVNLVGNSMGGGVSLEIARDPDFGIESLTVFEPMGFEHRDWLKIGWNYYVEQGGRALREARKRIKILVDQRQDGNRVKKGAWGAAADLLRREQFRVDCLTDLKVKGRFQVWFGEQSPLINIGLVKQKLLGAENERLRRWGGESVEFFDIEGEDHTFPLINSMGIVSLMLNEKTQRHTRLREGDLVTSVAMDILRRLIG